MVNPIENNNNSKSYPLQPRNTNTGGKHTSVCLMCVISKKHNITLPESVIEKLSAERVVESGEFEFLDSARLSEIGIKSKADRIKVLKLVKMYNNEELIELTNSFEKAYTRSQLQTCLYLAQQERLSLVSQMPLQENRIRFTNTFNCHDFFHGRVAASVRDEGMHYAADVLKMAISSFKKAKLRETDYWSLFYQHDPVIRKNMNAEIAQHVSERKNRIF